MREQKIGQTSVKGVARLFSLEYFLVDNKSDRYTYISETQACNTTPIRKRTHSHDDQKLSKNEKY